MGTHNFTQKETELIELLKTQEMTKSQILAKGFVISRVFLMKCEKNGILLYESDEENQNKKYGVLKSS